MADSRDDRSDDREQPDEQPADPRPADTQPAADQPKETRSDGEDATSGSDARLNDAVHDPDGAGPCVVAAVGASAGGLDVLRRLLQHLPVDTGVAYVVVQHLDPTHVSLMAEILARHTSMPVSQIEDGVRLEPNHVYMIPPDRFVRVEGSRLRLEDTIKTRGLRLPIDHLCRSIAEECGARAITVVLSGTGSDGAEGVRAVKAAGGMTVVESPEDAEYDGMPRSAVATGCVDHVLPVDAMPEVISRYAQHPYTRSRMSDRDLAARAPNEYRSILGVLSAQMGQDFSRYKPGTMGRRIERRMGIRYVKTPESYLEILKSEPDEVQALFRDLLIGVTEFFRTPNAWVRLAEVIRARIRETDEGAPFRVWVPGCSTGEEAYSLAILLAEIQEELDRSVDVQIFATDIDVRAIDVARRGRYPEGSIEGMDQARVDSFFQSDGDVVRVTREIRQTCVFAVQNLLSDPPLSSLDLISCRNLLIYLDHDVQARVFEMFHFALAENGILFLGSSESPGSRKSLFSAHSSSARAYVKQGSTRPGGGRIPVEGGGSRRRRLTPPSPPVPGDTAVSSTVELAKRTLLDQYVPPSVVVDGEGVIEYIQGSMRGYLDFPSGAPDLDLTNMVLTGLKTRTRRLLREIEKSGESASVVAPRVRRGSRHVPVRLEGRPLRGHGSPDLFMISFFDEGDEEADQDEMAMLELPSHESSRPSGRTDRELELELQATREDLQSTIEELESANEELKASNEEVRSMNEELQSSNEELQTSREELQSLNEELSTVNNQLHEKISALEETTDDLSNFLASTDIATLFLDSDLHIRRFNPTTTRLLRVADADVGRPIGDLAFRVDDPDLEDDAERVLTQLVPVEREVTCGPEGPHFIRRITPFRTGQDRIAGVVVTYSDVTSLRGATERVERRERQQAATAQLGRLALSGAPVQTVLDQAVREVADTLDVEMTKVLRLDPDDERFQLVSGVGWDEGLVGTASVPATSESQAGYTLQSLDPVRTKDLATERRFSGPSLLTNHSVSSGVSVVIGPGDRQWGVLGAHTSREREFTADDGNFLLAVANVLWECIRRAEQETTVRRQLAEIGGIYDAAPIGLCFLDEDLRFRRLNDELATMNGASVEAHLGRSIREVVPQLADTLEPVLREILETGEPALGLEVEGPSPDGEGVHAWIASYAPVFVDGVAKGLNTAVLDITERREMMLAIDEAREAAEAANDAKTQFLANMSHEIRSPLTAILGFAECLHDQAENGQIVSMVRAIKTNGTHLRQILDDILDLAKVEAGKVEPSPTEVSPGDLLARLRSFLDARAAAEGISLSVDASDPVPATIHTDPRMLRQILLNLIGNAIKFTTNGGVQVRVSVDAAREEMTVAVADSGPGIQPAKLERIFEPFEQADNSSTREAGGTGLGLAISKRLAEALGGSLSVESEVDVGSTFTLTLPTGPLGDVEMIPLTTQGENLPPEFSGFKDAPQLSHTVLVVEDRTDLQLLVRRFLERIGCEVVTASDGAEAVEIMMNAKGIDAILMDIQMPLMDGLTAATRIRDGGFEGPIIALTARVLEDDRRSALDAGCDDFIAKPIEPAEFVEVLVKHLGSSEGDSVRPGGRSILYIEDHADAAEVTKMWLEQRGHSVVWAASGAAAVSAIRDSHPQVILMDLGLPDMKPEELLGELSKEVGMDDIDLLCMTGREESDVPWRELGFDGFLQKPVDLERLGDILG